ncbi:MAG: hypothetical protein J3R72DRAFT_240943 [Linnemannia gamsii]|nr:MAG: hypothetical protein J3R72DRAFT_240943 [Linnemannia gamsii]
MLHSLCCWSAQQQSPPASPISPSNGQQQQQQRQQQQQANTECSCSSILNEKKTVTTNTQTTGDCRLHQELVNNNDDFDANLEKQGFEGPLRTSLSRPASPSQHHPRRQSTTNNNNSIHGSIASLHSVSSHRSNSSRNNYLRGFLSSSRRNSPVSSPPLTPAATSSSAPTTNANASDLYDNQQQQHSSPGKSPTKFSLQKFYYPRNSMTATSPPSPSSSSNMQTAALASASPPSSTPGSFSRLDTGTARHSMSSGFEGPRALGLIPAPPPVTTTLTLAPLQLAPSIPQPPPLSTTASEFTPAVTAPLRTGGVPILTLPSLAPPRSVTPTLMTILPSPTTPSAESNLSNSTSMYPNSSLSPLPFSLSTLSSSYSTSSSASYSSGGSSPNTSPSTSPTDTTCNSHILSPTPSELTPYPARSLSPARLAAMLEKGGVNKQGARSRPLILDLRPLPDFDPVSIVHSININLPTLLMRRYRKGGAVSSFALESFITIPSDKELYHLIQDGWRQDRDTDRNEMAVRDVVVLDHEMRSGQEEYGRSASPAWTLVSVLERGGGNCAGNGPIQLWFLEGGFEAFQAWDASEKYIRRPGSEFGSGGPQGDVEMAHAELESGDLLPLSMPLSLSRSTTSSTMTDAKTAQAIDTAVSLTTASLGSTPRQRGPPARRESLFSLNTKSLQRPAGLSRAQTIGVSALNIKPVTIPSTNNPSLQPLQEGSGAGSGPQLPPLRNKGSWLTVPTGGAPSLSPSLSLNIQHANNSIGSGHPLDIRFRPPQPRLLHCILTSEELAKTSRRRKRSRKTAMLVDAGPSTTTCLHLHHQDLVLRRLSST